MEFFSHPFTGDTDATQMLKDTFRMLDENRYMNADVLLISDYRIPKCKPELLKQMSVHREKGTLFYGLQIGIAPNEWTEHFDHIYRIVSCRPQILKPIYQFRNSHIPIKRS